MACAAPDEVFAALRRAGIAPQNASFMAQGVQEDALPLFAHNESTPFVLASTAKLVTSLAALDVLGTKFRWQTRAYALGPVRDGVLEGDLLIVGGGDARLSVKDLQAWFKKMQAKGLREIRGNIRINRAAFQTTVNDHINTPVPTPDNPHHAWPDALMIDEGIITVDIAATPFGPQASYSPRLEGVEIANLLQVSKRRCGPLKQMLAATFDELMTPPRITVQGDWPTGCGPSRLYVSAPNGSRFVPLALAAAWRDAGGQLTGEVVQNADAYKPASLPKGAKPFSVLESPPLAKLLFDMNKWSNNLIARHLLLSLAKGFPNKPATLPEAKKRLGQWFEQQGMAKGDVVLDNGSGLSHNERGRADVMTQMLRKAWSGPFGPVLFDSLPVAGEDGTISNRFKGPDVRGNAFLKTGTLNGVRALAGYVRGRSGRIYAITTVINDPKADKGLGALDAFIEWVINNG